MEHPLTIQDIVLITGKSKTTIHRYLKKDKLKYIEKEINGNNVFYVDKKDLEQFLGYKVKHPVTPQVTPGETLEIEREEPKEEHPVTPQVTPGVTPLEHHDTPSLKESIREVIEDFFQTKQTQLMKPIEDQALYRLGILENEVTHLKKEKELLLEENDVLRNQLKMLPGPVEEVSNIIQEKDNTISDLKEQLQQKSSIYEEAESKYKELEKELNEKIESIFNIQQEKTLLEKENKDELARLEEEKRKLEKDKEQALIKLQAIKEEFRIEPSEFI